MLFERMGIEFEDKIMLYCFGEVKCKQGFTTGIWYCLYNALGLTVSTCISGLMVSELEYRYDDPGWFRGRRDYDFTFQLF